MKTPLVISSVVAVLLTTAVLIEWPSENDFNSIRNDFNGSVSFDYFEEKVVPILENRCSISCHGVATEQYPQFMAKDEINGQSLYFPINHTGKIPRDKKSIQEIFKVIVAESS